MILNAIINSQIIKFAIRVGNLNKLLKKEYLLHLKSIKFLNNFHIYGNNHNVHSVQTVKQHYYWKIKLLNQ